MAASLVYCAHLLAQQLPDKPAIQAPLPVTGYYGRFCIAKAATNVQLPATVFGCGVADCCASCSVIDASWQNGTRIEVTVSGAFENAVSLRFENLTPDQLNSLNIPNGQFIAESEVKIPSGESTVQVPRDFSGAILITPVINMPFTAGDDDGEPKTHPPGRLNVEFKTIFDELELGQAGYVMDWDDCGPSITTTCLDAVEFQNHTDSEPAVVMLDGETDFGCINDVIESGMATIPVGNFLEAFSCHEEAVVFARDKAMQIFEDADSLIWSAWTDLAGDIQPFLLGDPRVELPLNIQIAVPNNILAGVLAQAVIDGSTAQSIMQGNRMGISLTGTDLNDLVVVGQADRVQTINDLINPWITNNPNCANVVDLVNDLSVLGGVYDPQKLNIYYVSSAALTGAHFRYCPADPTNQPQGLSTGVVFIGRGSSATSFTHEIGHALSLDHVGMRCRDILGIEFPCGWDYDHNGYKDFGQDNLMFVDYPDPRLFFSIGQALRANANETSLLNTGLHRIGEPTRICDSFRRNKICPVLSLDSY